MSRTVSDNYKRLKAYIAELRRRKKVEQPEQQDRAAGAKYDEGLASIRCLWPQLIPHSLKNKKLRMFREQTSSEALCTFTCASCTQPMIPFEEPVLSLCKICHSYLKKKKIPVLSLANRTFIGSVPNELKNLTVIEAMIARCRSKCWVIQLKAESEDIFVQSTQRGMRGHIIVYPHHPSRK